MTDDTITPDNTLNCSANPLPNPTVEQSYYRRFHLPDYGVTGPFTVTGVTFGIQTRQRRRRRWAADDRSPREDPCQVAAYFSPT